LVSFLSCLLVIKIPDLSPISDKSYGHQTINKSMWITNITYTPSGKSDVYKNISAGTIGFGWMA
jgi:hypothetical protein